MKKLLKHLRTSGLTKEEIKFLFKESDTRFAQLHTEFHLNLEKTRNEWERRIAAEDERRKAEYERRKAEDERQRAELNAAMRELAEASKKNEKLYADLNNSWGRFLENLCAPAALALFKEEGIDINHIYEVRSRRNNGQEGIEVDVVLCDGGTIVAVEVKSTLNVPKLNHFLRKMEQFKHYYSEFAHYKVYGAVAAVEFQNNIIELAREKGIFVIECSGEGVFKMGHAPELSKRREF